MFHVLMIGCVVAAVAAMFPGFHPLPGQTPEEQQAGDVKEFTGAGTPYLKVPLLTSLLGVRVGPAEIPLTVRQRFPVDPNHKQFAEEDVPMVSLQTLPDGTPVLLRNIQSNNGMWQAGETIYVRGEWAPEPEPKARRGKSAPADTTGAGDTGQNGEGEGQGEGQGQQPGA